ncbi:MAG TPA: FHA domain-containing protein [Thermoanaerobaculia bacterium]|nr:FHA domain-containing protein [Thermoanaerobaculia bacterium]
MIIECTNCHSKYQYNEERFGGKASKKIKCAKCANVFEIFNPGAGQPTPSPVPAAAAAAAPARASDPGIATPRPAPQRTPTVADTPIGDQTFHRKPQPKEFELEPEVERRAAQPPAGLQMPAGKRLSLAIIDGPDAGNVIRIEKPRVTIGRSGADVNLNDTEASRQHAVVEIHDTTFTVNDLGSTNGTLVNGEKVTAPTEIVDKGEFVVGNSTIMLIVTEDSV